MRNQKRNQIRFVIFFLLQPTHDILCFQTTTPFVSTIRVPTIKPLVPILSPKLTTLLFSDSSSSSQEEEGLSSPLARAEETILIPPPPPMDDLTVITNTGTDDEIVVTIVEENNDDGNNNNLLTLEFDLANMNSLQSYNDRTRLEAYLLLQAALIGMVGGAAVAAFKSAIEETRHVVYGLDFASNWLPLIPALGGIVVGLLSLPGSFPPGLKGSIREVDKDARRTMSGTGAWVQPRHPLGFLRKTAASVATLGTGSSLGPEGPSVEVGLSISRLIMNAFPPLEYILETPGQRLSNTDQADMTQRGRLLLSCGAAAGVSAGFNAPLAGVFFALEIVEAALWDVDASKDNNDNNNNSPNGETKNSLKRGPLAITSILVASVLSALVFRTLLGNEMVLSITSDYDLKTPLNELPTYMMLGTLCGVVSVVFSGLAKASKSFFDGNVGPTFIRQPMQSLPYITKPALGGLLCGLLALPFPQILFFGYETLNALLNSQLVLVDDSSSSISLILPLMLVKMIATALAAGSGLVGGTFAPSLFLGAMTGAAFHQVIVHDTTIFSFLSSADLADTPAYAIVGAASVLAALFRAPLTASLLLFELTRDYDVLLPLMVSAGLGSLVADIIENTVEQDQVEELRRDRDSVSWGDLSDDKSIGLGGNTNIK